MTSQFSDMASSKKFFDVFLFLLPSLVLILELWQFFFKGLAKNPEIGNIRVWILPNIWRLVQIMDIKFGTNVFNRM